MTKFINYWTHRSPQEEVALKSLMIMPALLLQKPSLNSKSKENSDTLKRRLSLWVNGHLDELLFEGKTIQDRMNTSHKHSLNYLKKR